MSELKPIEYRLELFKGSWNNDHFTSFKASTQFGPFHEGDEIEVNGDFYDVQGVTVELKSTVSGGVIQTTGLLLETAE